MTIFTDSIELLRTNERRTHTLLRQALESHRLQKHKVSAADVDLLKPGFRGLLPANNVKSRVRWGTAVIEEFRRAIPAGTRKPLVFGTLCSAAGCTDDGTVEIDCPWLVNHYQSFLKGVNYIGMIEPAYYVNISGDSRSKSRLVLWHVHFLSWGTSKSELARRLTDAEIPQMWDGVEPFDLRSTGRKSLPHRLSYMLKAPRKSYQVSRREYLTPAGEVVNNFRQWKRELRAGERVKLFAQTSSTFLDRLCIAGGAGEVVRQRAIEKTRVLIYRDGPSRPTSLVSAMHDE